MTNRENELQKTLRPAWVFALAIGSEVGWGAFILPFDWLHDAGLGGILGGFALATILIIIIGQVYSRAIRELPASGGGVLFAMASAGRFAGFVAGWALALAYAGIVALNASAVTLVFRVAVPGLLTWGELYSVAGWHVYLPEVFVSILFVAVFAYLNTKGFEFSGRFQFWAVVLMLAGVVIVVVMTLVAHGTQDLVLAPMFPDDKSKVGAIFAIVAIAPWAFIGFDTIPQIAGEFKFSPQKVSYLLVLGIMSATLVYVSMSVATAIGVGTTPERFSTSGWPAVEAITSVVGPLGMLLMVIAVSAGVLTGLNGFTAAASRVLWVMGDTGLLSKKFSRLSVAKVPTFSIVAVAIICMITPWFGRAALSWVVDMTSAGVTIAYFFASFFVVKLALGKVTRVDGSTSSQRSSGDLLLGVLGCVVAIGFLLLLLVPGSPGALGVESRIALAVWAFGGVALFMFTRKQRIEPVSSGSITNRTSK